ncbi:MAG: VWA domain-containing protein [Candidatus Shapirobacteria bacterium]|nr:VWA domain-containing protein [Candidatus Shapirobacteria bacterium]
MNVNDEGLRPVLKMDGVKDPVRSPEEARAMMKEVSWLSKVFSGHHDVRVVALPGEGPWTCGIDSKYAQRVDAYMQGKVNNLDDLPPEALVPKLITIRENDFYHDPAVEIRRKTRHEAAHAAHSDFKSLFEGARKAKDEGYLPSTYMSAANGPEDGWVNAMAAGESQAAMEDFRQGYSQKMAEISPQLPQDPLSRQFGVNAINYWLTGKDVEGLDPRVVEVTNKVRPALDRFFKSNSAQTNAKIFGEDIWPIIRELEKADIDDEQMRQAANEAMNQLNGQDSEQGNQSDGQSQSENGNLGKQIENELGQGQQGGERQSGEPQPGEPQPGSGEGKPMDLSKLSPETKEKLRQMIENMGQEGKEKLKQAARAELDRKQSEKLNEEAPQIIQMEKDKNTGQYLPKIQEADPGEIKKAEKKLEQFQQEETAKEKQEMEQARVEAEQRQRGIEALKERQKKLNDMKQEGFDEDEEVDYDRYKQLEKEIDQQYRELKQELGRIFPRQQKVTREGYYYSGRPDPVRAAREYPVGSHKFYERKEINPSQQVNLTVWIALDISGSMGGSKMDESTKNIIMWSKLCEEFSIPTGIILFGNSAEILKNSNQPYSDPEQKIKAKLISRTNNLQGSTNIGAAVEIIGTELKSSRRKFPGMQGVGLFITDGSPNTGTVGEELARKIAEVKSSFSTFAFGLGSGETEQQQMQTMLAGYFGEESAIVPKQFEELPRETTKVMSPIMHRLAQRLRY